MEREALLSVLIPAVCGFLWLAWGSVPDRRLGTSERVCWRRLWAPLAPGALALAVLVGWALQEPDPADETARPLLFLVAALFAVLWARAGARAARSLLDKPAGTPAATVGLLRPRVVIAPRLARALDPAALRAARAHEEAHARHRDPLRVWLAHLAADLQWPWPQARRRLRVWRRALEEARDDEARSRGIDGADLASAILAAARLRDGEARGSIPGLSEEGALLRQRVLRLLSPETAEAPRSGTPWGILLVLLLLAAALVLGFLWGDDFVRALPGVIP